MKIGLYGIGGLYNFGCEAIVRGCCTYINRNYQNAEIIYYSSNYLYDSEVLQDIDITVKEIRVNPSIKFYKRAVNKVCRKAQIPFQYIINNYHQILREIDIVFFIGGDILTLPKFAMQKKRYFYMNSMVEFGKKAVESGIPIVLYGASVGPFGTYPKAVKYYAENLKKYEKIICREFTTIKYLESIGVYNTEFEPDPAFYVNANQDYSSNVSPRFIGVNFSPLSLVQIYGRYSEEMIGEFSRILTRIYDRYHDDILLIPHVISKDILDDDYRFQQALIRHLPKEYQNHIQMADHRGGFLKIKAQLPQCKIVVSSRMHCAINALHENVPTIFLSYSAKSKGMCNFIYGDEKWVIDIKQIDELLLDKMDEMLQKQDEIREYLVKRINKIQEEKDF